jgi:hypothetical protein
MSAWSAEFYATADGREPCREWLEGLTTYKRQAVEEAISLVLEERGLDVVATEYGKALGQGLYEFRLRWSATEIRRKEQRAVGPGLASGKQEKVVIRVFFCTAGQKFILLLSGYDKARDPSSRRQQREIDRARKYMADYRARHR